MRRGPLDQRPVEPRSDVLCYRSSVLATELEAIGPVQVVLYVSSDAPDTDFCAKLLDVYPDGRAMGLQDGILRCRHRESFDRERLLEPGEVTEIQIDLPPIAHVFLPGHRIGLDVSSSNFPRFDRNLNTGLDNERTVEMRVAQQTVYHSGDRPSRLVLPVVPSAEGA